MRTFSTTAKALINIIWSGTTEQPKYKAMIEEKLRKNNKLKNADRVEIAGAEHTSTKDSQLRVSGQIYQGPRRLTSVHAYDDGRVEYSKKSYNDAQE
ncbi:MAG: hypothetical protein M1834_007830 [Cirrosporium novae-zelandiae]|nr:MAG: hypothetical protein M1834_007830 [Cirrosporium novae-zelandiae]